MDYTHPEVLVSIDWVQAHLDDPQVRLIEVDVDTSAYDEGHIPGAVGFNWQTQLQDTVRRDIPSQEVFEQMMSKAGVGNHHKVVLYGDNNNWFAAYAFWLFKIYGHEDVVLMNGGRKKWVAEERAMTKEIPQYPATQYRAKPADLTIRAFSPMVMEVMTQPGYALVDVRSPQEFTGEILAPPGLMETAQRGGHIPGAANIPWAQAAQEDGTFKPYEQLKALYESHGITPDKKVVAYCRIGERSSHTWFVLRYLLGYTDVRNYDGSWTEWGNIIGAPIEREVPTELHGGTSQQPCPT
jgi:thiosulfate/3-mercaptopyruvate sulfurtransferase